MRAWGARGALEDEWLRDSREQLPAGSVPGSQGAEAEIFYLRSGLGRIVKGEKWQSSRGQRRPRLLSSRQTDENKCHAFRPPTRYCPFGTHARTHTRARKTLGGQAAGRLRAAAGRRVTEPAGRLTDHLGRAASDRVSSGDPAEASAPGRERHHGKLTPHGLGPELRFGSVASGCPGQLQTPRCFRGGRCGLRMSLGVSRLLARRH